MASSQYRAGHNQIGQLPVVVVVVPIGHAVVGVGVGHPPVPMGQFTPEVVGVGDGVGITSGVGEGDGEGEGSGTPGVHPAARTKTSNTAGTKRTRTFFINRPLLIPQFFFTCSAVSIFIIIILLVQYVYGLKGKSFFLTT